LEPPVKKVAAAAAALPTGLVAVIRAAMEAFASIAAFTSTFVEPPPAIRTAMSVPVIEASSESVTTPPEVVAPSLGEGSAALKVPDDEDVRATRLDGLVPELPTTASTWATVAPVGKRINSVVPLRLRLTEVGAEYLPAAFVTRKSSM
jgi:hypothetical protein